MSKISVSGWVLIELINTKTGEVIRRLEKNTIVAQGRSYIRNNIIKASTTYDGNYIFLSTSTSAPQDNETSVPSTILGYKAYTSKQIVTDSGVDYCQWETTFGTSEGNGTIGSIALAEQSTGAGEWGRVVLSTPINKTTDYQLNVKYRIRVDSA